MKIMPSTLTPFVRSDAVGALLAESFTDPAAEWTIAELGRRAGVGPAVAHKEIARLLDGGVLLDRKEGRNRLVRVNQEHPLYAPMAEIIAATYGPVPVLRQLLQGRDGVERAFLYGSWAARRAGQAGPSPRDLDVMVVGNLDIDDLLEIQQAASDQLHLEVNIHRTTPAAWAHPAENPFLATVATRPLVWIAGTEATDE